jgi:hypothetical protein
MRTDTTFILFRENLKYVGYEDLTAVVMNEFGLQEYNDLLGQEHVWQVKESKR